MFVTPTLSISCITCMQQGEEGGNYKGHESPGKIRLDGFVPAKPYGGTGGGPWDDGMYHGVREITVTSDSCIESIRVAYDRDGELVNGDKHGGDTGSVNPLVTVNKIGMAHSEERYVASTVYGESGGGHWDDGLYHGVREITLRYGSCIDSFRVVYHRNGERIQAIGHGGNGGGPPKTITFGPNEVLKTVSGSVGAWTPAKHLVIRSLKFETNIRAYGPFGEETDNQFTFTVKDGEKVIGFFGRSGVYLDAFGFHVARN